VTSPSWPLVGSVCVLSWHFVMPFEKPVLGIDEADLAFVTFRPAFVWLVGEAWKKYHANSAIPFGLSLPVEVQDGYEDA
jgi:hypothetical protein